MKCVIDKFDENNAAECVSTEQVKVIVWLLISETFMYGVWIK